MRYLLALGVLLLTGCGTWKQDTITVTDWYKVGFQEAQSGFTENWRHNYHMVSGTPDDFNVDDYKKGYRDAHSKSE